MGLFREADTAPPPPPDSPPTYGDLNLLSYLSNLPYNGISQHQIPGFCFCLHVEAQETVVLLGLVCLDGFVLAIRLSCSCLLYHLLRFTLVILSTFLCKKGYLWSIFTFSLLPLFFPFLLCFPSKPLCVPPPFFFFFFSRQSSFYPCSVWCPPVGSAFHHPGLQSRDTGGSGAVLLRLWSLMWPAADVHSPRGEEEQCTASPTYQQRRHGEGKILSTPLSKCLSIRREVTLSGLYEIAHHGTAPTQKLGNSPRGNEMPPVDDLLWGETLHIACSRLTLRAAWCHSASFYWGRNDKWWSVMWGDFVDSWHTNLQSLEEMDDTWWSTVHLLLHKSLALTGRAMWNV